MHAARVYFVVDGCRLYGTCMRVDCCVDRENFASAVVFGAILP